MTSSSEYVKRNFGMLIISKDSFFFLTLDCIIKSYSQKVLNNENYQNERVEKEYTNRDPK